MAYPDGPAHRKLLLAARAGDLTLLKAALSAGAHPDAVSTVKKQTALDIALLNGDAVIARALLDAGAHVWGNPAINEGLANTPAHWGPYMSAFKSDVAYGLWPLLWERRGLAMNEEALFLAARLASRAGRLDAFKTILHHCHSQPTVMPNTRVQWMAAALLSGALPCVQEVERLMGKLGPFEMSQALLADHGLASQPDKKVMPCIRYAMGLISKDALALRRTLLGIDPDNLENCMVLWWIGKARKERVAFVGELVKQHPALSRTLKKHTFELLCRAARRGSPAIMQDVMAWVGVSDLEPWAEGQDDKTLWAQVLTNQTALVVRMGHFALAHGLASLVNQPVDAKGRTVLHRVSGLHASKPAVLEGFLDALVAHGARLDVQDTEGETAETALLRKGFAAWVARQRERTLQENLQVESQHAPPPRVSLRF